MNFTFAYTGQTNEGFPCVYLVRADGALFRILISQLTDQATKAKPVQVSDIA